MSGIPRTARIGEEKLNNQGCLMKIIDYKDCHNVTIQFQDEEKFSIITTYQCFEKGNIKNPYFPELYGVGYIGIKYPTRNKKKKSKEYAAWSTMLERGYSQRLKKIYPTYQETSVCKEWHNFENFYEWIHSQENFEKWLSGERWEVDKDIIVKGNKIYSPETCVLVPPSINNLFIKADAIRGDLPVGVKFHKQKQKYEVACSINGKQQYLATVTDPVKGFCLYKKVKEGHIKDKAEEAYSKGEITKRCYEAMMNYQVEITD